MLVVAFGSRLYYLNNKQPESAVFGVYMRLIYAILTLFTWFEIILCFILFMPVQFLLFIFTAPFDKKRRIMHYNSGAWSALALFLSPILRLKVTGKEYLDRSKAHVVVMNHQSLLDILLSFRLFYPVKMIGKKVLGMVPIIGWNLFLSGHLLVDRKNRKSQFAAIRRMEEIVQSGDSLLIYPEGTRTKDGEIAEFKKGGFRSASSTGTSVLPVVLDGAYQALPKGRIIIDKVYTITLTVLPPIEVEKGADTAILAKKCHDIMSSQLKLQRQN